MHLSRVQEDVKQWVGKLKLLKAIATIGRHLKSKRGYIGVTCIYAWLLLLGHGSSSSKGALFS